MGTEPHQDQPARYGQVSGLNPGTAGGSGGEDERRLAAGGLDEDAVILKTQRGLQSAAEFVEAFCRFFFIIALPDWTGVISSFQSLHTYNYPNHQTSRGRRREGRGRVLLLSVGFLVLA